MSLQLLKSLNGNKNGLLKSFLGKFTNSSEPRITWYPSAGTDFRALLYISEQYSKLNPANSTEPAAPDIFIFTDYFMSGNSNFLDSKQIYKDEFTQISVVSAELLPELNLELPEVLIDFPKPHSATNKVAFLNVRVESDVLGTYEVPVIYVFAVNEEFMSKVVLPNDGKLSHIINIRYGGGLGGGGLVRGNWVPNILNKVGCELYISDNSNSDDRNDELVFVNYPNIANNHSKPTLKSIRTIDSKQWSNYGDVSWNEVV